MAVICSPLPRLARASVVGATHTARHMYASEVCYNELSYSAEPSASEGRSTQLAVLSVVPQMKAPAGASLVLHIWYYVP